MSDVSDILLNIGYDIGVRYPTRYLIHGFGQQGLILALGSDMAEVITGSEFIVKAYAERHSFTATAINDLIMMI